MALTDSLDELIQSGHINPQLAMRVLMTFDRSISEALSQLVRNKANIKVFMSTWERENALLKETKKYVGPFAYLSFL